MTNQEQYEMFCDKARKYDKMVDVLDKIRNDIESEMNNLYRQPSIDQRTLTIIHTCQRHIEIVDKYIGRYTHG